MKRLSNVLEQLAESAQHRSFTVSELIERLSERGPLVIICFFCIPFLFPIPLPGISTAFGTLIAIMALGFANPKWIFMPKAVANRKIESSFLISATTKAVPYARKIERFSRRRITWVVRIRYVTVVGMLLGCFLLALPIPPVVLFSNSLPALAIIFYAFGSLEDDGLLVLVGHGFLLTTIIYFAIIWQTLVIIFQKFWPF